MFCNGGTLSGRLGERPDSATARTPSLPFSDDAVFRAPDGILPRMAFFGGFAQFLFVDGHAEAGQTAAEDTAVLVVEDGFVLQVVEHVRALVVVDAEALLLDNGVRRAIVELEAGREGDGAERAVRRDGDVETFRHGGDFADFRDAACMAEIGLDDIRYPSGNDVFEAPAGEIPFACGDRRGGVAAELRERFDILDENRLFDEHKILLQLSM